MESATPPSEYSHNSKRLESNEESNKQVVQFSLLPTTQTTTVVTTTTVSTTFPPVVLKRPKRKVSQWDSTTYPLHDSPTPKALRKFCFELDGKSATFTEEHDSEQALIELQETVRRLHATPARSYTKQESKKLSSAQDNTAAGSLSEQRKRQQSEISRDLVQSVAKRRHVSDVRPPRDVNETQSTALAPKPVRPSRPTELLLENPNSTLKSASVRSAQSDVLSDENSASQARPETQIPLDMTSPQSLSLPSPSASPVLQADLQYEKVDMDHVMLEDTSLHSQEQALSQIMTSYPQAASVLGISHVLDTFDDLPQSLQSYLMYHLLKRCNKNTLQVVASVVNPALKRDFLDLLPYELSLHVMSYLDARSLARAAQVSKRWAQLVDEDEYTWKNRLEQDQYYVEDDEFVQAVEAGWDSRDKRRGSLRLDLSAPQIPKEHFADMVDGGLKQPLVGQHLYKSIYKKHHINYNVWMNPKVEPNHLSFESHGRHVVTCLQLDDDKIITGSEDSNINIFDVKTGALRLSLEGHEGGVWALQYLGNILVSGSTDRTVRIWDMLTGSCLHIFEGHTSTVRCLQILPVPTDLDDGENSHIIITGSRDSTLRVWRLPQSAHGSSPQALSPAQSSVAGSTRYCVKTLSGHLQSVRALAADGDTLVSGSYDCSVRVWRISTGKCLWKLSGHTQKVYSVVLDTKQNRCISGSMDCKVKIWDLLTGICLYTLDGHSSLVGLLSLSHDRLVSAAADSTLRIWNPTTGACAQTLSAHTGAITCFQHDGDKVISGSDGTLKLWDLKTGQFTRDLLTGLTYVWQVRFDDRRCVAAVQRNGMTYIDVLDFGAAPK